MEYAFRCAAAVLTGGSGGCERSNPDPPPRDPRLAFFNRLLGALRDYDAGGTGHATPYDALEPILDQDPALAQTFTLDPTDPALVAIAEQYGYSLPDMVGDLNMELGRWRLAHPESAAGNPDGIWSWVASIIAVGGPDSFMSPFDRGGGGGGGKSLFHNGEPQKLDGELATARRLGVRPLHVTDAAFEDAVNTGTVKWAVTAGGDLVIVPKWVSNAEIKHTVLTGGRPVLAAGEADIAADGHSRW